MPEKLFYEGQEVVCIDNICTPIRAELNHLPRVHYGNLYTIQKYEWYKHNVWWVSIVGMPEGCIYSEDGFAPTMCIKELIEEREEAYA